MKQPILCGICGQQIGWEEGPFVGQRKHPKFVCGDEAKGCAPLWHKFRTDVSTLNVQAASLSRDLLTLRGATALDLHLKILETNEAEAQKLAGFGADFNEAIKGDAKPEQLLALGVKR